MVQNQKASKEGVEKAVSSMQPKQKASYHPFHPPFFNGEVQKKVDYRDGDIIVSVPGKCGTTWNMNIVHQIRSGGDAEFEDLYEQVPWLEVMQHPKQTVEERVEWFNGMPHDQRRAFKTHSAPPDVPYFEPSGEEKDVRYIVVVRNPEEAMASSRPFLASLHPEWKDLWSMPQDIFDFPDFKTFYDKVVIGQNFFAYPFEFVSKWWPLRKKENVLFLHFNELKRDHEGSVRKVADFLGYQPTNEQWDDILEYTGFPWMKANETKFEITKACAKPILMPGAMVRKGAVNRAREDGWTEDMSRELKVLGREILTDEVAFQWLYTGIRLDLFRTDQL